MSTMVKEKEALQTAVRFLAHDTPASMVVGQSMVVNLRIENTGATKWQTTGTRPAHIGYRWFGQTGTQQLDVEDRRTGLLSDVYPRQDTAFGATLVAPKTPGNYKLHWNLTPEDNIWSPTPLIVPVLVTQTPTDITGWRTEANLNNPRIARALDGDPTSFWDSGIAQAKGHWFRLNLNTPRMIDGIQFLSPGKGFPNSYLLRVSADGRNWNPVAQVEGNNQYDVMSIFAPQSAQYAQLDLLDGAPGNWLISEILIHPATAWTASASHNPKLASRTIDNRPNTAWTSGVAQTREMWFQIDLGNAQTVSGITLASPAGEHPASYRISVWNASTHRWQTVAEKLENTEPLDVYFAATQAQFINVQLLRESDKPWTIQQAHVAREVEHWLGPRA